MITGITADRETKRTWLQATASLIITCAVGIALFWFRFEGGLGAWGAMNNANLHYNYRVCSGETLGDIAIYNAVGERIYTVEMASIAAQAEQGNATLQRHY